MDQAKTWKGCWHREFWLPVPGAWFRMGWGRSAHWTYPLSPADSPSSRERHSQRRARAWPFKLWELRQESHLLEFKSDTDCSGLQPPFIHSINVSSILYLVIHLKHECDLSLSFLKLISVSSLCKSLNSSIQCSRLDMVYLLLHAYVLPSSFANFCSCPDTSDFFMPSHHSLWHCLCLECPSAPFLLSFFFFSLKGLLL